MRHTEGDIVLERGDDLDSDPIGAVIQETVRVMLQKALGAEQGSVDPEVVERLVAFVSDRVRSSARGMLANPKAPEPVLSTLAQRNIGRCVEHVAGFQAFVEFVSTQEAVETSFESFARLREKWELAQSKGFADAVASGGPVQVYPMVEWNCYERIVWPRGTENPRTVMLTGIDLGRGRIVVEVDGDPDGKTAGWVSTRFSDWTLDFGQACNADSYEGAEERIEAIREIDRQIEVLNAEYHRIREEMAPYKSKIAHLEMDLPRAASKRHGQKGIPTQEEAAIHREIRSVEQDEQYCELEAELAEVRKSIRELQRQRR